MSKRRNRAIRNVSEKVDEVKETVGTEVKTENEVETEVKTEVKEKVEKKTATDVYVQYGSVELKAKDIVQKVKNIYSENGKSVDDIDTLKVYIKPEENVAYYVINDEEKGSVGL